MRKMSWITCPRSHNWCMQSRGLKPNGLPPDIVFLTIVLGHRMVSGCTWASVTFPDMHTALSLTSKTTPSQKKKSFLLKDLDWAHKMAVMGTQKEVKNAPCFRSQNKCHRFVLWNSLLISWYTPNNEGKTDCSDHFISSREHKVSTSDELWDLLVLCKWEELERRPFLGYRVYFIQKLNF